MNYTIFKLSYILYLQKKYYPTFKLGEENIYVLPPILKRRGLFFSLAFPVAKRFDKNTISRPVGVILVNKNAKEKFYDMSDYEFTNFSQDFKKKYTYKTYEQEYLKVTLHLLLSCYPKFSVIKTKDYTEKYLARLKNSFDEKFWNFYEDLQSNKITLISSKVIDERKLSLNNNCQKTYKKLKIKEKIKKKVDFELKNFVRNEIWNTFKNKNAFSKLTFLDLLGATLKKKFEFIDKNDLLKQKKFEVVKNYAKSVNLLKVENENINYLSKLLIIFLNSMLIEEKENKVIESFEVQIKDSCALFDEDLPKIEDIKIRKIISSYKEQLIKDYSTVDKKYLSNVFSAYLFLFLN
ncbi:MAG: hypothetical protein EOM55_02065 [Clostridia bacterium]|nr:hypothetical protein [Clostridia bacterium]